MNKNPRISGDFFARKPGKRQRYPAQGLLQVKPVQIHHLRPCGREILRELLREARQFNAREYRILAGPAVVDLFLDEESQSLAMLSDFIGKSVSLQSEPSYSPEQYDIVLM